MYACMHKHARVGGSGSMLPQCRKLDDLRLLLRPFLDKSRAVVATCTWLAEYIVFSCPRMHLLSQLTSNIQGSKVGRTTGNTTGEISSAWNIYSDLFTHVLTRVLYRSSAKQLMRPFHHEQSRAAATRLVLTAVILNIIDSRGPISNGRALKVYS